jgi:hypothetical protein
MEWMRALGSQADGKVHVPFRHDLPQSHAPRDSVQASPGSAYHMESFIFMSLAMRSSILAVAGFLGSLK